MAKKWMAHLKEFKNLQRLHLDMCGVEDENFLAPLADLPYLRILHLGIPTNLDCLTHLEKLSLEELELYYENHVIGSHDLENLEGLPLRKLSLSSDSRNHGIEDAALTHLKKWHLEELEIIDWSYQNSLTNAGVAHLGGLFSLKKLKLTGENLTGACLIHLQNLSHLEEFSYHFPYHFPIEDKDLSDLKKKLPLLKINGLY